MEDKELSFWEHLDVLRWALVRIVCVWFVLAIGYFALMPYIFDSFILGPTHDDFIFNEFLRTVGTTLGLEGDFFTSQPDIKLQNINVAGQFFTHLNTAFIMSIVTATPYIFWEVWLFIRPALYANESRSVKKALGLGAGMFYLGVAVGYFTIFPMTIRFLNTYQLSDNIVNEFSLTSYIDNFTMLVLCMGLAFELPLVTWLLSLFGLITRSTLREYRRLAVVIIVIIAAIITPTGDPFTLMAVSLPLYALYEFSILVVKESHDEDDDDDDNEPEPDNNGGNGGGDGEAEKAKKPTDNSPVSPAADAKEMETDHGLEVKKNEDNSNIANQLKRQRDEAQLAKNRASNAALQQRLDAQAAATAAGVAGGAEAAAAEGAAAGTGEQLALTANAEPTVKEALATAAVATKKREPHMVIIDDQIYFEDYPEESLPPMEEEKEQPLEEQAQAAESNEAAEANQPVTDSAEPEANQATDEAEPNAPQAAEPAQPSEAVADHAVVEEPQAEPETVSPQSDNNAGTSADTAAAPANEPQAHTSAKVAEPQSAPANNVGADTALEAPAAPAEAQASASQPMPAAQEKTAPAAETSADVVGEEVKKAAPVRPAIDVKGIKYDFGRYGNS